MAAKVRRAPSWKSLRRDVPVTAVIDDGSERRLACDFAYYPPVPQARGAGLDRRAHRAAHRLGMVAAGPQSASDAGPRRMASRPTLLVAMGGSDPHGPDLARGPRAGGARSGLPHPLCHRHRHEGCAPRSPPRIVALTKQLRNRGRRRRSGHRICQRRSGAVRLRRHRL